MSTQAVGLAGLGVSLVVVATRLMVAPPTAQPHGNLVWLAALASGAALALMATRRHVRSTAGARRATERLETATA